MPKKIVLLATDRYSINANDFYMFFRRSQHEIVAVVHRRSVEKKCWWVENQFEDPARDKLYDPIDFASTRCIVWDEVDDLLPILEGLEFDYLCMGNGSGQDQQAVVKHVGLNRCLFSEYGWLPWSRHFYISRKGCGNSSEISEVGEAQLQQQPIAHEQIQSLRRSYRTGWPLLRSNFVYVPLQKDVNDFKFNFTHFGSNEEFLDFIHDVTPRGTKVLVKRHPLYKKKYDLKKYGRFIDISDKKLSKASLYTRMQAMVCINSTSILEALLFGGTVFAYGQDLFLNKGLVHFGVTDREEFSAKLAQRPRKELADAFVSLLIDRQIDRKRCIENDRQYIDNHYWNQHL